MAKYLIVGDTYEYRKEIRSLGGDWRKKYKGWDVPNSEAINEFMKNHPEFEMLVIETIEQLRERAQEVADEKADRLLERAAKKRQKAEELKEPINSKHGDIAFFTQPNINSSAGRAFTRQRERMYDKLHKGFELENEAEELERRAESLRNVQIQGDAKRRKDAEREKIMERLEVGMEVTSHFFQGPLKVVKKNKKTVRVQSVENPNRVFSIDPRYLKEA